MLNQGLPHQSLCLTRLPKRKDHVTTRSRDLVKNHCQIRMTPHVGILSHGVSDAEGQLTVVATKRPMRQTCATRKQPG